MNPEVKWIGIRPERKGPVQGVESVYADVVTGLDGDHDTKSHRQVTLISYEALAKVARILNRPTVDPAATRRNILISGLGFDLAEGTQLQVGETLLQITGPCLPCSRMDDTLGAGGRDAMADAGGLTARILKSGRISVGDTAAVIA